MGGSAHPHFKQWAVGNRKKVRPAFLFLEKKPRRHSSPPGCHQPEPRFPCAPRRERPGSYLESDRCSSRQAWLRRNSWRRQTETARPQRWHSRLRVPVANPDFNFSFLHFALLALESPPES